MNKRQKAKCNTIHKVISLLDKKEIAELIDSYDTMRYDVNRFMGNVAKMNVQIVISGTDYTGLTKNQTKEKSILSKYLVSKICAPSARYARNKKDRNLLAIFNHSEYDVRRYGIAGVMAFVGNIIDRAEELMLKVSEYANSTKITPVIIAKARELRGIFGVCLGQAKMMKVKISLALETITEIQTDIWNFDFPNLIDDAQHFETGISGFLKALKDVTKIDNLPTEHTAISGYGHDIEGNVIEGGAIYFIDLPKRKPMSFDQFGYFHDEIFKWGIHRIRFTHPDYLDLIITVIIARGKRLAVNVVMEKKEVDKSD